jgi:hypothetical protein
MSQENVELIRGLWEPFNGVDNTAIDWDDEAIREMTERFWTPEIELRWAATRLGLSYSSAGTGSPQGGTSKCCAGAWGSFRGVARWRPAALVARATAIWAA